MSKNKFGKNLEVLIGDVLASYWLKENLYCGLSTEMITMRLSLIIPGITYENVLKIVKRLEKSKQVSTRRVQGDVMVYPKEPILKPRDPLQKKDIGIYTKQLRWGGSPVELRFFKRKVLDEYLQDPRYKVNEYGAGGSIGIKDKFFLDPNTPETDKVSIQAFGTAYKKQDKTEVVAVMLVYLGELSKEHQNHWASCPIHEECLIDSDFATTNIEGKFTDRVSPFTAFVQEIQEINKMCDLMGEPHLFRDSYPDGPPAGFGWITKPTEKEFEALIHLTDKLLSENLNKDFFRGKVELEKEIIKKDEKVQVQEKGTLTLLEEYLSNYFKPQYPKQIEEMIKVFKDIRTKRQPEAHSVSKNAFDQIYLEKQKEFIYSVYKAIRRLRLIFMNYPACENYRPPKWLQTGKIL